MVNDATYRLERSTGELLIPIQLRSKIKSRVRDYLEWMRRNSSFSIPDGLQVLSDKYDFVFRDNYRHLNFYPDIMHQAQDMLAGHVDRRYHDTSPHVAVHYYVGHITSSQALCWNIVYL